MAEKVTVARAEVTELLGLPPDVDDETLQAEFQKALTRLKARETEAVNAAAEARLVAEDRRIVNARLQRRPDRQPGKLAECTGG